MAYDVRFNVEQTGAESIDQITSKMTLMKAQITATGLEMRQAGSRVVDAQKQIAEGAAFLAPVLAKEKAELDALVVKQREQKAALDALTPAIKTKTEATVEDTAATIALGAAHTRMVPQVAAASAAIRELEGTLPIRAVERFAVNVLGLGPILQAAFPVIGAAALVGVLVEMATKVYKVADNFFYLRDAMKAVETTARSMAGATESAIQRQQALAVKTLRDSGHPVAAAQLERSQLDSRPITPPQISEKDLKGLNKEQQKIILDAQAEVTPGGLNERLRTIRNAITDQQGEINTIDQNGFDPTGLTTHFRSQDTTTKTALEGLQQFMEEQQRLSAAEGASGDAEIEKTKREEAKQAAEAEKQEENRRKAEVHRAQEMERAGITDPTVRAFLKANDDIESFSDPDLRQRASQAGLADFSRAGLTELRKVQNELQRGRVEQETQGRETDKKADEDFRRDNARKTEALTKDQEAANKVKTFQNSLTTESTSEAVRANASAGSSADKMIGLNRNLSDAQKISALNQQDLATAAEKYRIEKDGAAELLGSDERAKANHKADLDNALELRKVQEETAERIAELEDKRIAEFREAIGGLFDAATSRTPRAIPNFIKGQVLNVGKTVAENVAQEYLLKPLQNALPKNPGGVLGTILKGTGLTKDDPLKTTAAPALVSAAQQLMMAARAIATSRSRGGGGSVGGFGGGMGGLIPSDIGGSVSYGGLGSVGNDGLPVALPGNSGGPSGGGGGGGGFGFNAGTIASVGAAAGAAFVAAKDFSKGGAQGAIDGIGALAGGAAALDPEPISKAVLAVAAIALPLIGSFFNGPQQRLNSINTALGKAQYNAPTALNATQDSSGDFSDFDARGNLRTSNFSAIPTVREGSTWEQTHGLFGGPPTFYTVPGGQTGQFGAANGGSTAPVAPITIHVNAIDTQSGLDFIDKNHVAVGAAAAKSMQNIHGPLTTEVQRAANP